MKLPRFALVGFLLAMAIVHAIIAFWTPIQGDAWRHWQWHGDGVSAWLHDHWTFSDAIGFVLARSNAVHVILTPAVEVALVIGVFVLAMRRLPRSEWRDVLGVALVSALIWIAQPRAGVTWFHIPSVATYIYGAAVAVWFIAPWRCGWVVPPAVWPLLAIAGYCVGTSSRAIAVATLIGIVLALRRPEDNRSLAGPQRRTDRRHPGPKVPPTGDGPRARWMWIGLGGLVVGVIAGHVHPTAFEPAVWSSLPVVEGGRLISLIAAFVLGGAITGVLGADRPDPAETLGWFAAWLAIAVWCVIGPHTVASVYLPATIALVAGGLPYLVWLARTRWLAVAIVSLAIAVHALVWFTALRTYHALADTGRDRLAFLQHTKQGDLAVVPPYPQIAPTSWFFGEDLESAATRQQLAIDGFGVHDIAIVPGFRTLEPNPGLAVELVVEGDRRTAVDAARPPAIWATELSVARRQFVQFVARLRDLGGEGASARLVVRGHRFAELRDRPLLVAWFDHGTLVAPEVTRAPLGEQREAMGGGDPAGFAGGAGGEAPRGTDDGDRIVTTIDHAGFTEAWALHDDVATSIPYDSGHLAIQPLVTGMYVIAVCDAQRCLAADAYTPRF